MTKKKQKPKSHKLLIASAISAVAIATSTLTLRLNNVRVLVPTYSMMEVVDGDTFKTNEDQIIRLDSLDAPEEDRCGGPEAKANLIRLIKNQPLFLKVLYRDPFMRLVSQVYSLTGSISLKMIEGGYAYYLPKQEASEELKKAGERARAKKLGIYSSKCTQTENPTNKNCSIKGNNHLGSTNRYYRFPGCGQYNNTLVELYLGDQWFCTEAEAIRAGFTKGSDCFNKVWKNNLLPTAH